MFERNENFVFFVIVFENNHNPNVRSHKKCLMFMLSLLNLEEPTQIVSLFVCFFLSIPLSHSHMLFTQPFKDNTIVVAIVQFKVIAFNTH